MFVHKIQRRIDMGINGGWMGGEAEREARRMYAYDYHLHQHHHFGTTSPSPPSTPPFRHHMTIASISTTISAPQDHRLHQHHLERDRTGTEQGRNRDRTGTEQGRNIGGRQSGDLPHIVTTSIITTTTMIKLRSREVWEGGVGGRRGREVWEGGRMTAHPTPTHRRGVTIVQSLGHCTFKLR